MRARSSAPWALLTLMASCSVGALDLNGKACPCAEGYVCRENVCVVASAEDVDAGGDAVDDAIAADDADTASGPQIVVSALSSPWQTPRVIRWNWSVDGEASSFLRYEIAWATTLAKLESGVETTVIGSAQLGELGAFSARDGKTRGPVDLWTTTVHTMTGGTEYFARITAKDTAGAISTAYASARTEAAFKTTGVLFDGSRELTATPASFLFKDVAGDAPYYVFMNECGDQPTCAASLALTGIGLGLAAVDFERGFLDVRLAGSFSAPRFDSAVGLRLSGCTGSDDVCMWRFAGWSQPMAGVIQVPLRELENAAGTKLSSQTLRDFGSTVAAIKLSGTWKNGDLVRLNDAYVRW